MSGEAKLSKQDLEQVTHTLANACGSVPDDDPVLLPKIHALIAQQGNAAVPMPKAPVGLTIPSAGWPACSKTSGCTRRPVDKLKAHPAAEGFPGPVPADAPRVTKTVTIDTAVPDWHSTGLYAAPGEALTVTLPASAVHARLGLRIGCHTRWRRPCPRRTLTYSRSA